MNEDTLPVTLLVVPIRYVYLRTRKRYMYYHIIKSISLSTFTIPANLPTTHSDIDIHSRYALHPCEYGAPSVRYSRCYRSLPAGTDWRMMIQDYHAQWGHHRYLLRSCPTNFSHHQASLKITTLGIFKKPPIA